MKLFMVSLLGLVLSVSVGAEPLLKGRVWLASGPPAAGVQVRLFDLTDLRRFVGTTTDEAGYFALPLATVGGPALPQDFALGQNYPNPFNPSTIIPYQIPTTTHVRLEVFNLLGQRLATLVDGERPAGAHTAQWDATDAAGRAVGAGVYIYRLTGGGHTVSRRMVLIDGQAGIPAGGSGPMPTAAVGVKTEGSVYGLTVAGAGLIAYVDPAFRVGSDPVDLVLEQPGGQARMKVATGGILGDVNNDGQVDEFDVLYVALYSKDPSITLPNNGDISLGDVNGDGTVDLADGLLLALYKVNPSDPTLPPGIGQPVDGSGDDHGDTPSAATDLAVGSSRSGQIEPGGDVDYFRVEVSASGDLTVHTTGSLDTKGQLEDSAGAVLARDDDGGDGYNFRLAHAVSAGTYYLKVEGYDGSTTGRYTIHASAPGGDGGPDLIVASASVSDNTLTPGQAFTLQVVVHNKGDAQATATTLHYYRSNNATITASDTEVGADAIDALDASATRAASISLTAPSTLGTYYYGACVEKGGGTRCSAGIRVIVENWVPSNGGSVTSITGLTGKTTLTAHPNSGYDFQRWTKGGETLSTDITYVAEATDAQEILAHFAVNQDRGKWNPGGTYTDYYFPQGAYESLTWTFVSVADPPESLSEEGLLHYYAYNFYLVNSTAGIGGGYAGFQSNGLFRGRAQGKVINYSIWGSNGGKTDGLLEPNNTESGGYQIMYLFEWIEGQAYRFELREGPTGLDARGKWWGLWVEDVATGSVTFVGELRVPAKINGRDATMWSSRTSVFGEDLHWWRASRGEYICSDFQPSSLAILEVTAGAKGIRPIQVSSHVPHGRVNTWPNGHVTTDCHVTLFESTNGDAQHNLGFWPEPPPNVVD